MSEIIDAVKAYTSTPEGKEWFLQTFHAAQQHHDKVERDRKDELFRQKGFLSNGERKAQLEEEARRYREELNKPFPATVSKSLLEQAVSWNQRHSDEDGKYRLYLFQGDVVKPVLIRPGDQMTATAIIGDIDKVLSGEEKVVKGTDRKFYSITIIE